MSERWWLSEQVRLMAEKREREAMSESRRISRRNLHRDDCPMGIGGDVCTCKTSNIAQEALIELSRVIIRLDGTEVRLSEALGLLEDCNLTIQNLIDEIALCRGAKLQEPLMIVLSEAATTRQAVKLFLAAQKTPNG